MREISRIAVEGVPSSVSRAISFNATSSPVWLLRPLKTYLDLVGLSGGVVVGWRYRGVGAFAELGVLVDD